MLFRVFTVFFLGALSVGAESSPYKIGKFPQEVGHTYGVGEGLPSEKVARIAYTQSGALYAATDKGLAVLSGKKWLRIAGTEGKAWNAVGTNGKDVFAASGKALFRVTDSGVVPFADAEAVVTDLGGDEIEIYVGTERGILSLDENGEKLSTVDAIGRVAQISNAGTIVGAGGVYSGGNRSGWYESAGIQDSMGRRWATDDVRGVAVGDDDTSWICVEAGVVKSQGVGKPTEFLTGADGLPFNDFTCAEAGPDGEVWLGTTMGAIRYDGKNWNYRQGKAWLPGDKVNDIAVDAQGGAWIATDKGIGYIERRMMTLAEKAEFYEQEVEKYIKRTPYGYTSEVTLKKPGDRSSGIIYSDSDNDGLWTSMYGAGECFAYGATKSPASKERATKAFEALRFLQKVTQGGEHSPPKGYVARTIRDINDPDPNIGRLEHDREERATGDKRWKVYEPRWPKSADGKWYWKTDTSSDELDGHYFFYPLYYDLVAETPEEKARVQEVVRDLTDHLVEHDFALIDVDGTKTRWAIYGPDDVNGDLYWWPERGLNSLSMLAYLAVAEHVTGDAKYGKIARELIDKHHYLMNLNYPKFQWGPGTGNQSDDEMAVMSFYNLVRYTKDDEVRETARFAFYRYWIVEFPEMNPFFNFAYAAVGLDKEVTDNWGTYSITPLEGWLDDSMATLLGFPLDRCDWAKKNSHRLDLQHPILDHNREPYEADGRGRGYRVNGKVLPVEERYFHHYNTDPWALDYGGNGTSLGSGAVFTLPYYMGRYHGFIEEAE